MIKARHLAIPQFFGDEGVPFSPALGLELTSKIQIQLMAEEFNMCT